MHPFTVFVYDAITTLLSECIWMPLLPKINAYDFHSNGTIIPRSPVISSQILAENELSQVSASSPDNLINLTFTVELVCVSQQIQKRNIMYIVVRVFSSILSIVSWLCSKPEQLVNIS